MMNISEIRLNNLRLLLNRDMPGRGQLKKLADLMDWKQQYASSIAGKNPSKNIGGTTARLIETKFGMPRDWLDGSHHEEWSNDGLVSEPIPTYLTGKQTLPLLDSVESVKVWLTGEPVPTKTDIQFPIMPVMELSSQAYVLEEKTDAMPPIKPGDFYYVDPKKEPKSGDWCVFPINGNLIVGELQTGIRGCRLKFHDDQEPPEKVDLKDCLGVVTMKMMGEFLRSHQQ